MADMVKIVGADRLRVKLRRIPKAIISKKTMSEIGSSVMASIKKRTLLGYDSKGKKFKKYSPRYKFIREKKGLPANIVDLFFTGSMFSSMTFEAQNDEVRTFFMPTTDKTGMSNPEKAYYLHQTRKFFELSDEDVDDINEILHDRIREALYGR